MAKADQTQQAPITTYKTVRIPLIGSFQNRLTSADKDQKFLNVFPEIIKTDATEGKKPYLNKRAGYSLVNTPRASSEGRGIYYYNSKVYTVFGNQLYSGTTLIQTLNTSTGVVGWVETTGGTKYLMLVDGTDGWLVNSSDVVTHIVDADFPTPHIPIPAYLDGYVFLLHGTSESMYNCDLDDPTSWDPTNFLDAEMFPDLGVALARQNNQVICFGTESTEFFYDAANAVQSPLLSNSGPALQVGCAAPYAIMQNEKSCVFVSRSRTAGHAVWKIDGFEAKKISIEGIEKILDAEGSTISNARAFGVRIQGHYFYVLNLYSQSRTLVYDIDEGIWSEWSSNSSGSHIKFRCDFAADVAGVMYIQDVSTGSVYSMSSTVYKDNSIDILCVARTTKLDFDSMNRKFMYGFYLVGDINPSSTTISVRWSDDDYQTWSTARSISLSGARAYDTRFGTFRRRAFEISYSDNYPLRLEAMEITVNIGQR